MVNVELTSRWECVLSGLASKPPLAARVVASGRKMRPNNKPDRFVADLPHRAVCESTDRFTAWDSFCFEETLSRPLLRRPA